MPNSGFELWRGQLPKNRFSGVCSWNCLESNFTDINMVFHPIIPYLSSGRLFSECQVPSDCRTCRENRMVYVYIYKWLIHVLTCPDCDVLTLKKLWQIRMVANVLLKGNISTSLWSLLLSYFPAHPAHAFGLLPHTQELSHKAKKPFTMPTAESKRVADVKSCDCGCGSCLMRMQECKHAEMQECRGAEN